MIVNKPIASIKIGKQSHRLSVGKPVPENVLKYWKETKQLKALLDAEIIVDENKKEKVKKEKYESTE